MGAVVSFLTGFEAFNLSHASHDWFLWLSDATFWQNRLHGETSETQGPPWMKDLKGSANQLKQRMKRVFQRETGQQWKKKYVQERSVLFSGMGSQQFLYRHQQGSYAYLEHNVSTESREQRPMEYLAGSTSLSFDVWFCLLPDTRTGTSTGHHGRCAGGVLYGLDCNDLGDQWLPVVVDSQLNLYCSLLEGRSMVAANLQPNRWYHLALTYDRDKQNQVVYLGGVEVFSDTGQRRREWSRMAYQQIGTGNVVAGEGDFPYPGYSGAYDFRGLVDEFRVWQGVLNGKEIGQLSRGGTHTNISSCVSFNEAARSQKVGMGLEWVRCTRPAEGGAVKIL